MNEKKKKIFVITDFLIVCSPVLAMMLTVQICGVSHKCILSTVKLCVLPANRSTIDSWFWFNQLSCISTLCGLDWLVFYFLLLVGKKKKKKKKIGVYQ